MATRAPGLFPQHDLGRHPDDLAEPHDRTPSPMGVDRGSSAIGNEVIGAGLDLLEDDSGSSLDDLQSLYDPSPPLAADGVGSPNSSIELDGFLANGPEDPRPGRPRPTLGGTDDEPAAATAQWLPWYPLRNREVCSPLLGLECQ